MVQEVLPRESSEERVDCVAWWEEREQIWAMVTIVSWLIGLPVCCICISLARWCVDSGPSAMLRNRFWSHRRSVHGAGPYATRPGADLERETGDGPEWNAGGSARYHSICRSSGFLWIACEKLPTQDSIAPDPHCVRVLAGWLHTGEAGGAAVSSSSGGWGVGFQLLSGLRLGLSRSDSNQ
jgi:hypothetical protein